jgi:L-fuconolactonase
LQAEREPAGWLDRPEVTRGLEVLDRAGSVFDLMIRPAQFEAALRTVRRHPSLRFVIDHIGKPSIAERVLEPWASGLRHLAAEPNVACKLSGMVTVADLNSWTVADLRPYTDIVLESFGPSRLIFGSDWPVSTLAASYSEVIGVVLAVCEQLSVAERTQVMAGNARAWYRLRAA